MMKSKADCSNGMSGMNNFKENMSKKIWPLRYHVIRSPFCKLLIICQTDLHDRLAANRTFDPIEAMNHLTTYYVYLAHAKIQIRMILLESFIYSLYLFYTTIIQKKKKGASIIV